MFREYLLEPTTLEEAISQAHTLDDFQNRQTDDRWRRTSRDNVLIGAIGQYAMIEYLQSIFPWADILTSDYVIGDEIGAGDDCDLEMLGRTWDVKARPATSEPKPWQTVMVRQSQADRHKVDGYLFIAVTLAGHYYPLGGCSTNDLLKFGVLRQGNYNTPYYELRIAQLVKLPELLINNRGMIG